MANSTTVLYNPSNPSEEPKRFTFDFSYWSHDGFKENINTTNGKVEGKNGLNSSSTVYVGDPSHPNGHQYADQVGLTSYSLTVILLFFLLSLLAKGLWIGVDLMILFVPILPFLVHH